MSTSSAIIALSFYEKSLLIQHLKNLLNTPILPYDLMQNSLTSYDREAPFKVSLIFVDEKSFLKTIQQLIDHILEKESEPLHLPRKAYYYYQKDPLVSPKLAFICTGQGSQYLHMGTHYAQFYPPLKAIDDQLSSLFWGEDTSLYDIISPPNLEKDNTQEALTRLTETKWAQPAIGSVILKHARMLSALDIFPDFLAGHSYGEISALYLANVILNDDDFFSISRQRGALMSSITSKEKGAMTAVKASYKDVYNLLSQKKDCTLANHNAPEQVVISSTEKTLLECETLLKDKKVLFKRLPVSTAFHSPLVAPVTDSFFEFLEDKTLSSATVPIYSNQNAQVYPEDPQMIKKWMSTQISSPVHFVDEISNISDAGASIFIELGPSHIQSTLISQILKERPHSVVSLDHKRYTHPLMGLHDVCALLTVYGYPLNLKPLLTDFSFPV